MLSSSISIAGDIQSSNLPRYKRNDHPAFTKVGGKCYSVRLSDESIMKSCAKCKRSETISAFPPTK